MSDLITSQELAAAQAPADQSASMLAIIARAAADPACDIDKMERLLQMQERMQANQAQAAFNAAMSQCQAEMGPISADAYNPQTKSRYASFAQLDKALRPIYTRHGFALSYGTEPAATGMVGVVCFVSHEAGHTREYRAAVPSDGLGIKGNQMMTATHAFGSGASYGQRYLVKLIFNVAVGDSDDDGQKAGGYEAPAKVTAEQAADLQEWADQVVTNPDAFLSWLRKGCKDQTITGLSDVPAVHYEAVRKRLQEMMKEKGQ